MAVQLSRGARSCPTLARGKRNPPATGTSLVNFCRLSIFSRVFEHQFPWDGLAAGGVFSSRARADAQVLRASARATHAGRKPTLSIHFPRAHATQKFRPRAMSRGMSFVRCRCAATLRSRNWQPQSVGFLQRCELIFRPPQYQTDLRLPCHGFATRGGSHEVCGGQEVRRRLRP